MPDVELLFQIGEQVPPPLLQPTLYAYNLPSSDPA